MSDMSKTDGGEKYLKICLLTMYMSGYSQNILQKNWNIGDNTVATMQQNAKSSAASGAKRIVTAFVFVQGDPIIVELLREGQGDTTSIQTVISSLDNQIAAMLATESQ